MTPDELNRWIAEKVMGFYIPRDSRSTLWWKCVRAGDVQAGYSIIPGRGDYFDPCHRIDHAMMALERLDKRQVVIENKYDRWTCGIQNKTGKWFDVEPNESLPMAICLALYEAGKEGG